MRESGAVEMIAIQTVCGDELHWGLLEVYAGGGEGHANASSAGDSAQDDDKIAGTFR